MDNNEKTLKWYSPMEQPFELAGFAWIKKDRVYRRLPLNPKFEITQRVNELADNTAGGQIRFRTDSSKIAISVKLKSAANMYHMPATGQCGFDCYIKTSGRLTYCSTSRFDHKLTDYESVLLDVEESITKEVVIDFPLYQGVDEVLIGLIDTADIASPAPYCTDKKIIFYGTSIAQGGCASRPGMLYTNILSRKLNVECINLGFSGSGMGEPEIAKIITEIENPGCFVLDYEANAGVKVKDTLAEFINILRKAYPTVPIIVVSKTRHAAESFNKAVLERRLELLAFQRDTVDQMKVNGDSHIQFVDGSLLFGDEWDECTVDGSHPTDLGFKKMADYLEPVLKPLII